MPRPYYTIIMTRQPARYVATNEPVFEHHIKHQRFPEHDCYFLSASAARWHGERLDDLADAIDYRKGLMSATGDNNG